MNVQFVINGRFLSQKMTGVNRFAFELCNALYDAKIDFVVVAPRRIEPEYSIEFKLIRIGLTSSHIWEQFELPLFLVRDYPKAILINFSGLGPFFSKKNIMTIHDLSFLANPNWFKRSYYYYYKIMTPLMARKCLKILTVSRFSKGEIVGRLRIHPSKIVVVPNGVKVSNNLQSDRIKIEGYTTSRYILAVSSFDPRKNLDRLIRVFLSMNIEDCVLVVIGKHGAAFAKPSGIGTASERVKFPGHVNEETLAEYYAGALFSVSASLYEGFGLPNLESMARGCPVLASSIGPHQEVCGKAAVYFNPESDDSLAKGINRLLNDVSLRKNLSEAGRERAQYFSWHMSARLLVKQIEELVLDKVDR